MLKYNIIIHWSDDDQAFLAKVPELPGCMADGDTEFQALENVKQVANEWLEVAKELGRPIPEPSNQMCYV